MNTAPDKIESNKQESDCIELLESIISVNYNFDSIVNYCENQSINDNEVWWI